MQKSGISGMKSLDHLRSLNGALGGAARTMGTASLWTTSDSVSYGNFANLKFTAEKLLKEQASAKTDLEMMQAKLKRTEEHVQMLEAKLQEAMNENAMVRVKHAEDAKLWKGLDSKLSSTKMLCDQLTETLQHLACQARAVEEDKKLLEEKLSESIKGLDDANDQIHDLSAKLECAGRTIETGRHDILKLSNEKEEMEKRFREESIASADMINRKDALIKEFENSAGENKVHMQALDMELQRMQHELVLKEETCKLLKDTLDQLEHDSNILQSTNDKLLSRAEKSEREVKTLEASYNNLVAKFVEFDQQSGVMSNNVLRLFTLTESYCQKAQKEKDLIGESAKDKIDELQKRLLEVRSDYDGLKLEHEETRSKMMEFLKAQEFVMVQHAEECRLAEDKIRELESKAESLVSEKVDLENMARVLDDKLKHISEASSSANNQMEEMLEKFSNLESEYQDYKCKSQLKLDERSDEVGVLQNEIATRDHNISTLEDRVSELHKALAEKDQLNQQYKDKEKQLEEQKLEIQESLSAATVKLTEMKNQYDLMLEGKQLELSKHLKEISQWNDQAINDIRRKCETEKVEIVNAEKAKTEKLIKELESMHEERLLKNKEEADQYLMRVKEENGAMIARIQQEIDQRETNIRAHHKEELQRLQLQAENEMRERISSLRKEHEVQMQAIKLAHEDEYRKLQDELELQKSKEEKQKALLQLQWKVMSENQQNDQVVNSKEHSNSSIKMGGTYNGKEKRLSSQRIENGRKDVDLSGLASTPVVNLMKKVHNGNRGSRATIPKRSKVTHHEYEVETMNGRITKHKKTKSTFMFGPNVPKRQRTRTPAVNNNVMKMRKVIAGTPACTSVIGDLCSEGSLNPYTDDPYAFD